MSLQSFNSIFVEDSMGYIQLQIAEDDCDVVLDLVDFYCLEPDCDCHKLTLQLTDKNGQVYATFSYGWKSPAFYHRWGLDYETTELLTTGFLDPLQEQSQYAEILLETLLDLIKKPLFRSLIKKRYAQFKQYSRTLPPEHSYM